MGTRGGEYLVGGRPANQTGEVALLALDFEMPHVANRADILD